MHVVGLFFFVLLFSSGELTTSNNFNFDDKLPLLAATHSYTFSFSPHCSLPCFRAGGENNKHREQHWNISKGRTGIKVIAKKNVARTKERTSICDVNGSKQSVDMNVTVTVFSECFIVSSNSKIQRANQSGNLDITPMSLYFFYLG